MNEKLSHKWSDEVPGPLERAGQPGVEARVLGAKETPRNCHYGNGKEHDATWEINGVPFCREHSLLILEHHAKLKMGEEKPEQWN
ncbi:MAG TPA: hypothetical protein VNG29_03640 [Candidatus Paceibacterota bacterium]|nr:hypothetical protein [Candidatus Paceibacterota bacterium]